MTIFTYIITIIVFTKAVFFCGVRQPINYVESMRKGEALGFLSLIFKIIMSQVDIVEPRDYHDPQPDKLIVSHKHL